MIPYKDKRRERVLALVSLRLLVWGIADFPNKPLVNMSNVFEAWILDPCTLWKHTAAKFP